MKPLSLSLFLLILFTSCHLFNNQPAITVTHNGLPVQYSLELAEAGTLELTIQASDPDGMLDSVIIMLEGVPSEITALDKEPDPGQFSLDYTLESPEPGQVQEMLIIVNQNLPDAAEKTILLECLGGWTGDLANPVEIIIPEIEISGGGSQSDPAPEGELYYFNSQHAAAESDIRLSEPVHWEVHAKRYLKVAGTAVPDDSGYTDRGYHAVMFTVDNGSTKSYFTIPVGEDNEFRGYLYFKEPGTYTVMAYRAWDSYLYPKSRSTTYSVPQGTSTLTFRTVVSPGDEVPAQYHHLLPTRNVDSGTRYLREYAEQLTAGLTDDMAIVKTIFSFIATGDENGNFTYAYYNEIFPGYLDDSWSDIFLASHFLSRRQGVCNDFSELFAALTRSLGFKVQKVWGYIPDSTGHQWNRIEIDGTWYRLDST